MRRVLGEKRPRGAVGAARVWDLGFRVQGSGLRVQVSGLAGVTRYKKQPLPLGLP